MRLPIEISPEWIVSKYIISMNSIQIYYTNDIINDNINDNIINNFVDIMYPLIILSI
jgi:hypothetical protein